MARWQRAVTDAVDHLLADGQESGRMLLSLGYSAAFGSGLSRLSSATRAWV